MTSSLPTTLCARSSAPERPEHAGGTHGDFEIAQRLRFARAVAALVQDRRAALVAGDRIRAAPVAEVHAGEAGRRLRLAMAVAVLAHRGQATLVAGGRIAQRAMANMDAGHVGQRLGGDPAVREVEHRALLCRGSRRGAGVRSPSKRAPEVFVRT
jgi:hypothetical protein